MALRCAALAVVATMGPRSRAVAAPHRIGAAWPPGAPGCEVRMMCRRLPPLSMSETYPSAETAITPRKDEKTLKKGEQGIATLPFWHGHARPAIALGGGWSGPGLFRAAAQHQLEGGLARELDRLALQPGDQVACRLAADLDDRRADAGQARRLRGAEIGVVDAGDGDVLWDAQTGLAARGHGADGEDVVGGDDGGRPLRQGEDAPHQRSTRGERDRPAPVMACTDFDAAGSQRHAHAGAALARTVVALVRRGDQRDAAMAKIED